MLKPNDISRILIIKLRNHGDVLLVSPVLSILKAYYPNAEIDVLVHRQTQEMISQHPAITQLHCLDRGRNTSGFFNYLRSECKLLRTLMGRKYDLVIHLTDHPRGAWISLFCGARLSVAPRLRHRRWWWDKVFTHFYTSPTNPFRHTVERNIDALRCLGIYPESAERRLLLVAGSDAEHQIEEKLKELEIAGPFIHIHPGSRWFFKCWPAEKMARLIELLHQDGHTIILTAAPETVELAMIDEIQQQLPHKAHSLAGQLSLKQMAALSAKAQLFIGVDSAPMHIAAAMDTPTVAIFGPSGDKEWSPWMVKHRIVASNEHPCRPCGIDGCGGGKVSDCLIQLPVKKVYQAAKELLTS